MGVDLSPKGREPNLIVPAACYAAAEDQITFDEFGNNGITIVNAIAKRVHFYSRGLRSQLRSRIGKAMQEARGLILRAVRPDDVFGEPTHAKWEPARRPEEFFVQSPFFHSSEQGSSTWREYQIASRLNRVFMKRSLVRMRVGRRAQPATPHRGCFLPSQVAKQSLR